MYMQKVVSGSQNIEIRMLFIEVVVIWLQSLTLSANNITLEKWFVIQSTLVIIHYTNIHAHITTLKIIHLVFLLLEATIKYLKFKSIQRDTYSNF